MFNKIGPNDFVDSFNLIFIYCQDKSTPYRNYINSLLSSQLMFERNFRVTVVLSQKPQRDIESIDAS
jgi:hypothetical protein